jgi:hypothetical protein
MLFPLGGLGVGDQLGSTGRISRWQYQNCTMAIEMRTNFVQSVGECVFGTRGCSDHLPKINNKLVSVGCIFALWNGLKRSDELDR